MTICRPYKEAKLSHISQGFSTEHRAIDFAFFYGALLVSPEDCRIFRVVSTIATDNPDKTTGSLGSGYGVFMEALGNPKRRYGYWHCLPVFPVRQGDIVKQGRIVSMMGNSGFVKSQGKLVPIEIRTKAPYKGTHNHFSMSIDNVAQNPLDYIDWNIPISYDVITAVKSIFQKILNIVNGR